MESLLLFLRKKGPTITWYEGSVYIFTQENFKLFRMEILLHTHRSFELKI